MTCPGGPAALGGHATAHAERGQRAQGPRKASRSRPGRAPCPSTWKHTEAFGGKEGSVMLQRAKQIKQSRTLLTPGKLHIEIWCVFGSAANNIYIVIKIETDYYCSRKTAMEL